MASPSYVDIFGTSTKDGKQGGSRMFHRIKRHRVTRLLAMAIASRALISMSVGGPLGGQRRVW